MTAAVHPIPRPRPFTRLWNRELEHYPDALPRVVSLGIVVLATIVLYYQFYLSGAVATHILPQYHMSFVYFVNISVVAYLLGALASFLAGISDRYGRANIVTVGLFVVALLCLVGVPNAHTKLAFGGMIAAIGFVEGIILVATPALIRDFSPQLGRASAMGFWTLGPVLGSLVVSIAVSNTSDRTAWQDQYIACGVVGLVVATIALLGLRELAPRLRDQLMVSSRDRALIEARAMGIDVEASLRHPLRQMLRADIIVSAFAISVFLIIYYVAVGFFPIYFQTIFGFSQSKANALGNWNWAFNAVGLLVIGFVSDLVRVRKPFMIVGAVSSIAFTIAFLSRATHPHTSYSTFVWLLVGLSLSLGVAYAPWMASFTETVERRNPALTATGLAIWGLIIRIVIAVSVFVVPHVVNTVTPLVDKGAPVTAAAGAVERAHPGLLAALRAHPDVVTTVAKITTQDKDVLAAVQAHPDVVTRMQTILATEGDVVAKVVANPGPALGLAPYRQNPASIPPTVLAQAVQAYGQDVVAKLAQPQVQDDLAFLELTAPAQLGAANFAALQQSQVQADLSYLKTTAPQALGAANFAALQDPAVQANLAVLNSSDGKQVQKAALDSPKQWQRYFWIAVGGQVLFIPLIFVMAGFWDPRRARQQQREHEEWVSAELAKLGSGA